MRIVALALWIILSACGESTETNGRMPNDMMLRNDMVITTDAAVQMDQFIPPTDAFGPADMQTTDTAVLDMRVEDAAMADMMNVDAVVADMLVVDATVVDMMSVDAVVPDMTVVDVAVPDMMVVDMMPTPRCDDGVQNGEETGLDCGGVCAACPPVFQTTYPGPYERALRNPLKGFTTNGVNPHEWATLSHVYIRWNELEDDVSHGIDRIIQVTEQKFGDVGTRNVKVIPRVYLHWSRDDQKYWPADMQTDDYSSEQFRNRLTRLVGRLGQVWNNDPRVAFVELGIFGKWGEHHSPDPEPDMQTLAAQVFADAFPDKHVSVRHAWHQFTGHGFGEYWDSFGHYDQMYPHGEKVRRMNQMDQRYLTTFIGGEAAYNWGNWERQPGLDPTDSVRDPEHRNFVMNTIRWLHCSQLRWIHAYDDQDPDTRAGAELVQKAMGYRFEIETARFTPDLETGSLAMELQIRNVGSAPFYYDWPLMVGLLDPTTRSVVWQQSFESVDIRNWIGGAEWPAPDWAPVGPNDANWSQFVAPSHWTDAPLVWLRPAPLHTVSEVFDPPVPPGTYVVAVAVADPANGMPNLRFATSWYLNGGWHPLGLVSSNGEPAGNLPNDFHFDDPYTDQSIQYAP